MILLLADAPGGSASLQLLAEKTDLAEVDVRKRMVYWVSRRVAREVVIASPLIEEGDKQETAAALCLGYEIIENQAAEVSEYEAAGSLSLHTEEFDLAGNEVSG